MRSLASDIRLQFDEQRRPQLVLTLIHDSSDSMDITPLKAATTNGKKLTVEISQYREKRSLDSNAYLWVLLSKMAQVLKTDKDEVYLMMLERYGVFTHIIVRPDVVDRVISEWRIVRNLGKIKVGKSEGYQLQCYFGSSTYDTAEMSTLIDGVVSECREMGIETLTDEEIASMNQQWARP